MGGWDQSKGEGKIRSLSHQQSTTHARNNPSGLLEKGQHRGRGGGGRNVDLFFALLRAPRSKVLRCPLTLSKTRNLHAVTTTTTTTMTDMSDQNGGGWGMGDVCY